MELKYKRVLLKLSGEALAGENKFGLDYKVITDICNSIKKCADAGVEMGIVVGGGNFWRGRSSGGMADVLESMDIDVRVQTAITMQQVAEPYIRNKAMSHLKKGRLVIFGCGTGNPFFSTDTAAALRAVEIEADIFLKATMVDGVYDKDPNKYNDAVKYDSLTFSDVLNQELAVMDSTAATMCRDNDMGLLVFDLSRPDNIYDAIMGKNIGTIIKEN